MVLIKKPLADKAGQAVYQGIHELEAQVGIAQAVPVWKDEGNRQQTFPFFALRPFFAGKKIIGCRLALAHRVHIESAGKQRKLRQRLKAGSH
jgi:hypothetical protein